MDPAALNALLETLCSQDNAARGKAEAELARWDSDPRIVLLLLARIDAAAFSPVPDLDETHHSVTNPIVTAGD